MRAAPTDIEMTPAKGYEDLFLVSRCGRIYSLRKHRFLKTNANQRGYRWVNTTIDGKRVGLLVHRLVAWTFLPGGAEHLEVCHLDDDPGNNAVSNLEWGTHAENMEACADRGRLPAATLTPAQADEIRHRRFQKKEKFKAIAADYGISRSHASNICAGRAWNRAA